MSKSIGTLNATLRADAVQFLSELERADNAVRSHGTSMEQSINHTIEHVERKFSAARFVHGFLASFGIGTGSAIVEHAIEGVRKHFEEIEKTTKSIEEGWKEIAKIQIEISHIGESEDQKKARLQNIIAVMTAQEGLLDKKRTDTLEELRRAAQSADLITNAKVGNININADPDFSRNHEVLEINKKITDAVLARVKIEKELAELEHKISGEAQAELLKKTAAAAAEQARADEDTLRTQKHIREEMDRAFGELEKKANMFADLADPMKKYKDQLEELDIIQGTRFALSAEAAAAAVRHIREEMQRLQDSLVNQKLKEFFGPLDEESKNISKEIERAAKAWDQFGEHASSAIESMIVDGKSLRDTFKSIMKDIERAIFQAFLGDPLKKFFSGVAQNIFGGGGALGSIFGQFAGGGNVSAGELSVVGENGPELFQPSTSGLVLNNSSSMALAGGGRGGGDTFVIDARGADSAGLARLEAMIRSVNGSIEHRAISANLAYSRRTTPNYQPTA